MKKIDKDNEFKIFILDASADAITEFDKKNVLCFLKHLRLKKMLIAMKREEMFVFIAYVKKNHNDLDAKDKKEDHN